MICTLRYRLFITVYMTIMHIYTGYIFHSHSLMIIDRSPKYFVAVGQHVMAIFTFKNLPVTASWPHVMMSISSLQFEIRWYQNQVYWYCAIILINFYVNLRFECALGGQYIAVFSVTEACIHINGYHDNSTCTSLI